MNSDGITHFLHSLLIWRAHFHLTASVDSRGNHCCSGSGYLILNKILREGVFRFGHYLLGTADLLPKLGQNLFSFESCVTRMTTDTTFVIIVLALVCIRRLRVQRGRLSLDRRRNCLWIIWLTLRIQILR